MQQNVTFLIDEWVKFQYIPSFFIFVLLININENIGQHSWKNFTL